MLLKSIVKDERGLSLIEVALMLLIAGILTVPLIDMYQIYKETQKYETNESHITDVRNAINKFAIENGRYPVPAPFSLIDGDAGFGLEGPSSPTSCMGAWFSTSGMCQTPGANRVLIGSVPFNSIGLEEKDSLDYWGNRFLYAVSLTQTSASTYVLNDGVNGGAITVMYMSAGALLANPDLQDAVIVSHGENAVGAYTSQGAPAAPCNNPAVEYEDENCNMDAVFTQEDNMRSLVTGGTYYDDYTKVITSPVGAIWAQPSMATDIAWTGASRVGIGTTDPSVKVEVAGSATATNRVQADQLCNDGSACFDPEIITGSLAAMDCSKKSALGGAVTGLVSSSVNCGGTVDLSGNPADPNVVPFHFDSAYINRTACDLGDPMDPSDIGDLMVGIDATGAPICVTPP